MFSQPLKGYEKSSFKVYIFCAETVKICEVDTFCKCVAASGNISSFLMNVRLLLKDINVRLILKESVPLIFFLCVAASGNISMFLMNMGLLLKRY